MFPREQLALQYECIYQDQQRALASREQAVNDWEATFARVKVLRGKDNMVIQLHEEASRNGQPTMSATINGKRRILSAPDKNKMIQEFFIPARAAGDFGDNAPTEVSIQLIEYRHEQKLVQCLVLAGPIRQVEKAEQQISPVTQP